MDVPIDVLISEKTKSIKEESNVYYPIIKLRKSFHKFHTDLKISREELFIIQDKLSKVSPLYENIKVIARLMPISETTCKTGEYAIVFYSETKENYLTNIGYIGEQIDLFLESINIGVCWYGVSKPKDTKLEDLKYVIMMSISKVDSDSFRTDISSFKRKEISEIWDGPVIDGVSNMVRLSPSAVNTQSWKIVFKDDIIFVYRFGAVLDKVLHIFNDYFTKIDIGIFILILEISLNYKNINFEKLNESAKEGKSILAAKYKLSK